jgi:hypothetical protein
MAENGVIDQSLEAKARLAERLRDAVQDVARPSGS